MSKLSMKAKAERYDDLERENDLLHLHLVDTVLSKHKPDAVEKWRYHENTKDILRGTITLYRAANPCGGYVIMVSETGTGDHRGGCVDIQYLDDAYQKSLTDRIPEYRDAMERIYKTRNRLMREANTVTF